MLLLDLKYKQEYNIAVANKNIIPRYDLKNSKGDVDIWKNLRYPVSL